ncbi:fructose-bisphosphate aldolase [Rhodococcus rhodnii]|uniref:Alpha-1,6-mannanase n=2 Tax=Rhodococcus rhodnii TaxID=38312 RepID=R7WP97_9NOCA|nr:glycoside hydrolase family 76 protein [Rhodococcus rhodnii]EOM77138.1 alpha-1,6-mannanase [Rhodococcus rhodnii LMG 5362]TXG92129.1 fructose-bisphosphate aldolase [Rhodococcus rhodnii]
MNTSWDERADAAERAILERHVRVLWGLPLTRLGVVAWPATQREAMFVVWHYWWQAQLLDCMLDAVVRAPTDVRRRRAHAVIRAHRVRNLTGWTNSYHDDIAWLGLALERAGRVASLGSRRALPAIERRLLGAGDPIPWRTGSDFFNVPANGPAAILLARLGRVERAERIAQWIDDTLVDPETHLVADGIRADGRLDRAVYAYVQGVVLGLEVELARRQYESTGSGGVHTERVHRLVRAIDRRAAAVNGVLRGRGGGDGGLFHGILARYLADVATELPGDDLEDERTRRSAERLVVASAGAAWKNCIEVAGSPLFGHDWSLPAQIPTVGVPREIDSIAVEGAVHESPVPERDLSVQLSGWMAMEAAARVVAHGE